MLRSRAATILRFAMLATATVPAVFGQQPIGRLPSGEAILGFENPAAWVVSVGAPTAVTLSGVRTQGMYAFSVTNPGNQSRLNSLPVPSTATPLAGLGAPGSTFAVDIRFPASGNGGSLRLSINSPSKGLNNVPLGKASFGQLRPNTFQTIIFPIPDQARKALSGAPTNDLTFQLDMSVPGGSGEYLFDNLRVRSTQVLMTDATTKPPLGYGGSVDLDLNVPTLPVGAVPVGQASVEQTFDVGPVQIPDRFHLKTGTAGAGTSVQLDLGYSASSIAATCVYLPDTLDTTEKSYLFSSCTGGPQPGDIVSASWVRLTIINGVSGMRILAQLARRPVGDQMGSGIIPPMPTFWGDEDTCILATSSAIVTISQDCSDTVAQASKIVNDYFTAATQGNPNAGWIVTPVPESAKRHGNGVPPANPLALTPLIGAANMALNVPLNKEGHLNPGGTFDAYWALNGGFNYLGYENTNRATTNLDADFSAHGVILGIDVKVLEVSASANSDTGQTVPLPTPSIPPATHAEAHLYVFGVEYPPGGYQTDTPSISEDIPLFNQTFDAPTVHVWIFGITIGVKAQAAMKLSGGLAASGIQVAVEPKGKIGAHLKAAIDVFIASGGVDANIDLITVDVPASVQAAWYLDSRITSCEGSISGAVDADINLSSGGGHVDLVATFGFCPFCDDVSTTLFSWDPLATWSAPILHKTLDLASFPLPDSLCTGKAVTVVIGAPSSDNGIVVYGDLNNDLMGTAFSNNVPADPPTLPLELFCTDPTVTFTWTVSLPDTIVGSGCEKKVQFSNTAHQATIGLTVTHTVTAGGRTLTESGTKTRIVNVTKLEAGAYITNVENYSTHETLTVTGLPEPQITTWSANGYLLTGYLEPPADVPAADVTYRWSVQNPDGSTMSLNCNIVSYPQGCVSGGVGNSHLLTQWYPPNALGTFTVTLSAISTTTGNEIGKGTVLANFHLIQ